MIVTSYPGGLGATNDDWRALIATLSANEETVSLAETLTPFVSTDPALAVQYVEIPIGSVDAETIMEVADAAG